MTVRPHFPKEVRVALAQGDIQKANELLGYEFRLVGTVVHGAHMGRTIGFPTANMDTGTPAPLLPANGVYAVLVHHGANSYKGMANIGFRPTVDGKDLTFEVNLFDFDGDLYGEMLYIDFIDRVRDEKKFGGLDELTTQLKLDKVKIKEILSEVY
jgi:riboflavin kinase / FMN adenylyltransferase